MHVFFPLVLLLSFCWVNAFSQFTDHGPQVFAAATQGSHFIKGEDGREYVFTVVRGMPATLVGYDLESKEQVFQSSLKGTDGSWDMEVSSDNRIYITGNGKIYRYSLGDKSIEDLGLVLAGQKVVWDLVAGNAGKIYGGTYPDCRVFEYDPAHGFSDLIGQAFMEGENYVRSVAVDNKHHVLYAGIGSHAGLIKLDLRSGVKQQILEKSDQRHEFVYDMEFVSDLVGGDRIFAWVTSSNHLETIVYNVAKEEFELRMPSIAVKTIAKRAQTNQLYYTASGKVFVLDYDNKSPKPKEIAHISGSGKAGYFDSAGNYRVLTSTHQLYTIDPENGRIKEEVVLDVPKFPISIQTIFWGPDNKIWSSGYLAGEHGTYDPATGIHEDYPGLHQTEGMHSFGNKIYFGNYTKAELYSYDVTQAWNIQQQNPKFIGAIKNQDRPFAVIPLKNREEMLFGTVTGYGLLGGSITHLNIHTDQFDTYTDIIPHQSVVSLIEIDGKVIGGSSIFGGLGAIPLAERGNIFEWDPINKKVIWTDSIDNYWSISGLFKGPEGGLWGFADGTLFKYDLRTRKVEYKNEIYKYPSMPSHIWRNGLGVAHPNGLIYFTFNNVFYSFNSKTNELLKLRDNASLMILGGDGKIYFREGTNLWSYTP